MRNRTIVLAAAPALLAAAAPPAAQAVTIAADRGCYAAPSVRADTVTLTGAGFTPNARYRVTLDGRALPGGTGTTDGGGGVRGTFPAPRLAGGAAQRTFTLAVVEGDRTARTRFAVSRLTAGFSPVRGGPRRVVRFRVHGFALGTTPAPVPVYAHYVRPGRSGRVAQTVRVGTARGACGTIVRSAPRRLFPFAPARGTWRLQFDTSPVFRLGARRSPFLFYTVPVTVG